MNGHRRYADFFQQDNYDKVLAAFDGTSNRVKRLICQGLAATIQETDIWETTSEDPAFTCSIYTLAEIPSFELAIASIDVFTCMSRYITIFLRRAPESLIDGFEKLLVDFRNRKFDWTQAVARIEIPDPLEPTQLPHGWIVGNVALYNTQIADADAAIQAIGKLVDVVRDSVAVESEAGSGTSE